MAKAIEPMRNGLRLIQSFYCDSGDLKSEMCHRDGCQGRSVAMFVKLADGDRRSYCLCYKHCVEEWGEPPPVASRENPGQQMYFGRNDS